MLFSLEDKEMFVMEMCEPIFQEELLKRTDSKHSEVMRQRKQAKADPLKTCDCTYF